MQLYELDNDPKRKEFLDDLFVFMQKRGETPVWTHLESMSSEFSVLSFMLSSKFSWSHLHWAWLIFKNRISDWSDLRLFLHLPSFILATHSTRVCSVVYLTQICRLIWSSRNKSLTNQNRCNGSPSVAFMCAKFTAMANVRVCGINPKHKVILFLQLLFRLLINWFYSKLGLERSSDVPVIGRRCCSWTYPSPSALKSIAATELRLWVNPNPPPIWNKLH